MSFGETFTEPTELHIISYSIVNYFKHILKNCLNYIKNGLFIANEEVESWLELEIAKLGSEIVLERLVK